MNKKVLTTLMISVILFTLFIPSFSTIKDKISPFYLNAVNFVINNKYMTNTNGYFNPKKIITREELAQVIYNLEKNRKQWVDISPTVANYSVSVSGKNKKGSGVILTNGIVLTCNHVVDEYIIGDRVYITNTNNADRYFGKLIATDELLDLALIELEYPIDNIKPIEFAENVKIMEEVITVGNPFQLEDSFSMGHVSKLDAYTNGLTAIQFDMSVNNGNSGGGVFNSNGELITIIKSKVNDKYGSGLSYGVDFYALREFLDKNLNK